MSNLKKLVSKAAFITVTATFLTASVLAQSNGSTSGSGSNSCSNSGGTATCDSQGSLPQPCCIGGTDAGGNTIAFAACCKGSGDSKCAVKYSDGTFSLGAGIVDASKIVSLKGCIKI
jgi:hypothetical protein